MNPKLPAEYLLGNPEYAEMLMRALELKGQLPQTVLADLQAGIKVGDLTAPEFWWLRRQSRWWSGIDQVAVVASYSIIALVAAIVERNILACVERVQIFNTTAAALSYQYGISLGGTGIAATTNGRFRDDRQFGTPQSYYKTGGGSNGAAPLAGDFPIIQIPAGGNIDIPLGDAVMTGRDNGVFVSAFIVQCSTVNQPVRATIWWRERQLQQTEK